MMVGENITVSADDYARASARSMIPAVAVVDRDRRTGRGRKDY